jgi:predicted nucleotidyltransferase
MKRANETKRLIDAIVERLKEEDVERIVLFGSHAYGRTDTESDLDLYVVTRDETIPQNYEEHSKIYLRIAEKIRDIRRAHPVDLLVHTRGMYGRFMIWQPRRKR